MEQTKIQLSPDTWAYVDYQRSKLIVEIDLSGPKTSGEELPEIGNISKPTAITGTHN